MGKTKKCTLFKAMFCYSLRNFVKLIYILYMYIYKIPNNIAEMKCDTEQTMKLE